MPPLPLRLHHTPAAAGTASIFAQAVCTGAQAVVFLWRAKARAQIGRPVLRTGRNVRRRSPWGKQAYPVCAGGAHAVQVTPPALAVKGLFPACASTRTGFYFARSPGASLALLPANGLAPLSRGLSLSDSLLPAARFARRRRRGFLPVQTAAVPLSAKPTGPRIHSAVCSAPLLLNNGGVLLFLPALFFIPCSYLGPLTASRCTLVLSPGIGKAFGLYRLCSWFLFAEKALNGRFRSGPFLSLFCEGVALAKRHPRLYRGE